MRWYFLRGMGVKVRITARNVKTYGLCCHAFPSRHLPVAQSCLTSAVATNYHRKVREGTFSHITRSTLHSTSHTFSFTITQSRHRKMPHDSDLFWKSTGGQDWLAFMRGLPASTRALVELFRRDNYRRTMALKGAKKLLDLHRLLVVMVLGLGLGHDGVCPVEMRTALFWTC